MLGELYCGSMSVKDFLGMDKTQIPYIENGLANEKILNSGRLYVIPGYQREIRWKCNRVQTLIEDLLASNKFLGNILISNNKNNQYDIIDGQQRITAIIMILEKLRREGIDVITLTKFENVTYMNFMDKLKDDFVLPEGDDAEWDTLSQTDSFKELWDFTCDYIDKLDPAEKKKLAKHLQQSKFCVILSIVDEQDDDSRKMCVDYFIDINNKSVQLDGIDILKAYAFGEGFENARKRWEGIQKNAKKLQISKVNYPHENIMLHYFISEVNNSLGGAVKKQLDEDFKLTSDTPYKGAVYNKGTDIERLISDDGFYTKMLTEVSEFQEFIEMVLGFGETPGPEFKQYFLPESDDDCITNTFTIVRDILLNSNVAPKILIMKYYLDVLRSEKKTIEDIEVIYDINIVATIFTASRNDYKGTSFFAPIALKNNWKQALKKKANKLMESFPDCIAFDRLVYQDKVATASSGEILAKRAFALALYEKDGACWTVNQNKFRQNRSASGKMTGEHFFIPQGESFKVVYKKKDIPVSIPKSLSDKISYLGNYLILDKNVNSKIGNRTIKEKIGYIREALDKNEEVLGDSVSKIIFETAERFFCSNKSQCPSREEIDACPDAKSAEKLVENYYQNLFESEFIDFLSRLSTDIQINIFMKRKPPIKLKGQITDNGAEKEVELVTPHGYAQGACSFSKWPLYRLTGEEISKWNELKQISSERGLLVNDLEGCTLRNLVTEIAKERHITEENALKLFDFSEVSDQPKKCIYCMTNPEDIGNNPILFDTKEDMLARFVQDYFIVKEWYDVSLDEVKRIIDNRYDNLDEVVITDYD